MPLKVLKRIDLNKMERNVYLTHANRYGCDTAYVIWHPHIDKYDCYRWNDGYFQCVTEGVNAKYVKEYLEDGEWFFIKNKELFWYNYEKAYSLGALNKFTHKELAEKTINWNEHAINR